MLKYTIKVQGETMVSFKLSHHGYTEHYALATGEDQYLFIK